MTNLFTPFYVTCDAPRPWGIYFQDSASPQMEALIELHDNIMFYLVIILFGVAWIIISVIRNYVNDKSPISNKYLNHGTLIELIWTITPALILILIAFPSFKLLYLMDEVTDPSLTLFVEGHQWYWSYQYPDFLNDDNEELEFDSYLVPDSDSYVGALRILEVDNRVILPELNDLLFLSSGYVRPSYSNHNNIRQFTTNNFLLMERQNRSRPNDQDDLFKEVDELEDKWRTLDSEVEELTEKIREEDEVLETDEGETEVSKYIAVREARKDRFIGECEEERDRALFDRQNSREDKSLLLDLISKSTKKDIKTLESIGKELPSDDPTYDELTDILGRLKSQYTNTRELRSRYHQNDLPPILASDTDTNKSTSQDSSNSLPQDSSYVHQTDFNTFDPFGEE